MQKQVLVVNDLCDCGKSYYLPFSKFGPSTHDCDLLDQSKPEVSLVVFTGGADVDPSIYGEKANPRTYSNIKRDQIESKIFDRARELKIPIVGICRGAQFICAKSGGKLVQHITGHHCSHMIKTDDERSIKVYSTHHQMQLPSKDAYSVAHAEPKLSSVYEGGPGVSYEPEVEYDVVYYPKSNALGIQYHPECMSPDSEGFRYAGELIKRFFGLSEVIS